MTTTAPSVDPAALDARAEAALRRAEEPAVELGAVQALRRQLLSLLLVVFVLVAAGVVLFSLATGSEPLAGILDVDALRVSFVALAVVFALYVWSKERELRRAERALVESRVRAAALRERVRELSALTQAGKAMAAILSLEDVLRLIVESARDLLGAGDGAVLLADDERTHLQVAAWVGDHAPDGPLPIDDRVAAWLAEPRGTVVASERGDGIAVVVPLRRDGEAAVGLLRVGASDGRSFGERDLAALTFFAEHAAIAIANAWAYESEREARERLARMDEQRREFVAALSHDLKAPLSSILGFARLLRRGAEDLAPEQAASFVEVIDRQGRRILEMVERLVVATRLEEGRPTLARERLDLPRLVHNQIEGLGGLLSDRPVEVRVADDLPVVYGDRSAVEHMVLNLLDNAAKYSPPGTPIDIEVLAADGELLVSVTDSGPGIPEEALPEVFDRYRRATQEGDGASVGLGLYIVKSLSEAHGGRAWAENAPGRGARVAFTLPYRRDDR